MLINSFFIIIELINNYLYEKKTLLLLLLFFTAFSSCEEDLINSSILEKEDTSINAKTNSSELIKFEKVESDLKSYKSFKLAKKSSNTNVLYRKIVNTENNTVTYTLPLTIYSSETPYYLIQQIIKKDNDVVVQYLKMVPDTRPENHNVDILHTLTGRLDLLDENMEVVSSTKYQDGKALKKDPSVQSKTSMTCYTFTETIEVKCTNGGNHGVGQSCNAGYTNDAYYIITSYDVCYSGGDWFSQGGGYNSGDVGGGYAFDYQLNALLTNPTFKYADYITDSSHSLLLQAIRQWIPNNVIDLNGDLSALNDRVKIFVDNEQMFYDLDTYNQNTNNPRIPNMEITDYSTRVYEMFKFILTYPTLENGLAARYSVAYLDKNRMISWEDFFMTFKGIGKIMINNPNTTKEQLLDWMTWYDKYKSTRSNVRDYFNQNPQDLDILFALGSDFFNQNPNISWDYLENWFFNGNNLNPSVMNEYLQDLKNPDIVKPTKRFKNNTKINSIYNQAKTASNFKQYLKNFEPTFSVAHLLFDIGETTQGNYAVTSVPKDYWIKITFNQNVDWNNTPKIIIADTFMHEMIHAEIFRKLLSIGSTNGNIDINKITQYLNTHNYPGLFDYYVERTVGGENWQHEAMGAHYVNIMVNFLKQLYNNKYTDVEYKTIVWMGLKGTIAWNSLSQTERTLYETTWNEKYWTWEL